MCMDFWRYFWCFSASWIWFCWLLYVVLVRLRTFGDWALFVRRCSGDVLVYFQACDYVNSVDGCSSLLEMEIVAGIL